MDEGSDDEAGLFDAPEEFNFEDLKDYVPPDDEDEDGDDAENDEGETPAPVYGKRKQSIFSGFGAPKQGGGALFAAGGGDDPGAEGVGEEENATEFTDRNLLAGGLLLEATEEKESRISQGGVLPHHLKDAVGAVIEEQREAEPEKPKDPADIRKALISDKDVRDHVAEIWKYVPKTSSSVQDEGSYKSMNLRLHIIVTPPPCDIVSALANADADWELDRQGSEFLDFKRFFDSMFQVVDVWTETMDKEEYIDLLIRILENFTIVENGVRRWRTDKEVKHDKSFGLDAAERMKNRKNIPKWNKSGLAHILEMTKGKHTKSILSVRETQFIIAKLYDGRVEAQKKDNPKIKQQLARFDLFILAWFEKTYGSVTSGKRALKDFLMAVVAYAVEPDKYPRIALFAKLCGIPTSEEEEYYHPGLLKNCMLRTLTRLFGTSQPLTEVLSDGLKPIEIYSAKRFFKACMIRKPEDRYKIPEYMKERAMEKCKDLSVGFDALVIHFLPIWRLYVIQENIKLRKGALALRKVVKVLKQRILFRKMEGDDAAEHMRQLMAMAASHLQGGPEKEVSIKKVMGFDEDGDDVGSKLEKKLGKGKGKKALKAGEKLPPLQPRVRRGNLLLAAPDLNSSQSPDWKMPKFGWETGGEGAQEGSENDSNVANRPEACADGDADGDAARDADGEAAPPDAIPAAGQIPQQDATGNLDAFDQGEGGQGLQLMVDDPSLHPSSPDYSPLDPKGLSLLESPLRVTGAMDATTVTAPESPLRLPTPAPDIYGNIILEAEDNPMGFAGFRNTLAKVGKLEVKFHASVYKKPYPLGSAEEVDVSNPFQTSPANLKKLQETADLNMENMLAGMNDGGKHNDRDKENNASTISSPSPRTREKSGRSFNFSSGDFQFPKADFQFSPKSLIVLTKKNRRRRKLTKEEEKLREERRRGGKSVMMDLREKLSRARELDTKLAGRWNFRKGHKNPESSNPQS